MANLKAENEKIVHEAKIERDEMLHRASETAKQIIEEARVKAQADAGKILENAKAAIETEKRAALEEMKVQVGMLSLEVAEKLLKKKFATDAAQQALVDELLKDVKMN